MRANCVVHVPALQGWQGEPMGWLATMQGCAYASVCPAWDCMGLWCQHTHVRGWPLTSICCCWAHQGNGVCGTRSLWVVNLWCSTMYHLHQAILTLNRCPCLACVTDVWTAGQQQGEWALPVFVWGSTAFNTMRVALL